MSLFIKRLKDKQNISGSTLPYNHVKVKNFNNVDDLKGVDYLIIGTLTPCSGRNEKNFEEGYFYCSEKNWMYGLIDFAFEGKEEGKLVTAKKDFQKTWGEPKQIKRILSKERKIAFLDVVQEAIIHIDDSSDDSICPYVLDYNCFKKAKNEIDRLLATKKVVANSKNAAEAFKKIMGENNAIPVIPQRTTGRVFTDKETGNTYKTKDDLKKGWRDFFKEKDTGKINN